MLPMLHNFCETFKSWHLCYIEKQKPVIAGSCTNPWSLLSVENVSGKSFVSLQTGPRLFSGSVKRIHVRGRDCPHSLRAFKLKSSEWGFFIQFLFQKYCIIATFHITSLKGIFLGDFRHWTSRLIKITPQGLWIIKKSR